MAPVSSKEFLNIQATIDCGFTLKHVRDIIRTYIQLKSKIDKLVIDKLAPVLVDLSKLSTVVKNDVIKKDVYNAKIKNIEDKIQLTITQKLMKLKRKLQIIIMINILLLQNLIS